MPHLPQIILLSGTSSSGKTSIAKILQSQLGSMYLHVELDAFISMLPSDHTIEDFQKMVSAFHHAIAAIVDTGCNVIIDHVIIDNDWLHECISMFAGCPALFVGLDCGLPELERREKLRDVRRQGFARSQIDKIHQGKTYDLLLNTEQHTVLECVSHIKDYIATHRPKAFPKPPQRGQIS